MLLCSLITPKIRQLCFVLTNSVILNLLCAWTYGVINYGSGWRKGVVNQCLEFGPNDSNNAYETTPGYFPTGREGRSRLRHCANKALCLSHPTHRHLLCWQNSLKQTLGPFSQEETHTHTHTHKSTPILFTPIYIYIYIHVSWFYISYFTI